MQFAWASPLKLVNNALKYSKYIGVGLYRANGSVKLEVSDHNIGIPAAEQEKIFGDHPHGRMPRV